MLEQYKKYLVDPELARLAKRMFEIQLELLSNITPTVKNPVVSQYRASLLKEFSRLQVQLQKGMANFDEQQIQQASTQQQGKEKEVFVTNIVEDSKRKRQDLTKSFLILGGALVVLGLSTFVIIKIVKKYK